MRTALFGDTSTLFWTAALSASALAWLSLAWRKFHGRPSVPYAPRRIVPWTGTGVLMAIVCLLFIQATGVEILHQANRLISAVDQLPAIESPDAEPTPDEQPTSPSTDISTEQILVDSVCRLAAVLACCFLLKLVFASSLNDLGLRIDFAWFDVRIGIVAGVALIPPTLLLQAWLIQWIPSKHIIVELIEQQPDGFTLAVMFFSAVIVAPVAEEFFVRAIFQGWLEKRSHAHRMALQPGHRGPLPRDPWQESSPEEVLFDAKKPSRETVVHAPQEPTPPPVDPAEPLRGWFAALPILISSACFAALHFGHGPDPIPIFLFALALGYLYQRTHRLLPSIVLHALLNATSLALLWFSF